MNNKVVEFIEYLYIGFIGIEIILLQPFLIFPRWLMMLVLYGIFLGIKSLVFIFQLVFMIRKRSWFLEHGVFRSLLFEIYIPTGLLMLQYFLYLLFYKEALTPGIFVLTNTLIAINHFIFFTIYPRNMFKYLSNKNHEGYLKDHHNSLTLNYSIVVNLIITVLISYPVLVLLMLTFNKSNTSGFNLILQLAASLGFLFLPAYNYLEQLINKRNYELIEMLSKGEINEPVEFWRVRWKLRG